MSIKHVPASYIRTCDDCNSVVNDSFYAVSIYANRGCVTWKVDLCVDCASDRLTGLFKDQHRDNNINKEVTE
jgi:hypothetical protein